VSVRAKLLVIILFVALVPLTVSALMALGVHRRAYDDEVAQLHRMTATHGAARADAYLGETIGRLTLLAGRAIRWSELSPEEQSGALWLVYQQFEEAVVASLLDDKGRGVGPSAYTDPSGESTDKEARPAASRQTMEAFARRIPFAAAQRDGAAIGEPFFIDGASAPMLPLAVAVAGPDPARPWVVAVCLSLRPLCTAVASARASSMDVVLSDAGSRRICPLDAGRPLEPVDPPIGSAAAGQKELSRARDVAGREYVVAAAHVRAGWMVSARQSADQATAVSRRLLMQTALWIAISLVIAVAAGLFLGRSVSEPIGRLLRGADALASGDLSHRLRMTDRDEFGQLGAAFDRMSEQIAARDAEIRNWNQELQARVERRTRDLKEAHELLLRSQKLAALTTLSAGVAHEINNPLTGVLGITQVLLDEARTDPKRSKEVALLEHVERAGLRMKSIVKRILALSEPRTHADLAPVRINALLDATVHLLEREIAAAQIQITCDFMADPPPILGEYTQLQQALLQVLSNAISAMSLGGRITLRTWVGEDTRVRCSVADEGRGIAQEALRRIFEPFYTTKDASEGEGLGLAIVHRIVENHRGTIEVASEVGKGTIVTIALPKAKGGADLEGVHGG
jgi:two-component system, NtrC family, sensor kinase